MQTQYSVQYGRIKYPECIFNDAVLQQHFLCTSCLYRRLKPETISDSEKILTSRFIIPGDKRDQYFGYCPSPRLMMMMIIISKSIKNLLSDVDCQSNHKCCTINVSHNACQRIPVLTLLDRAIITPRTIHNKRPDMITIDKTIKETHSVDAAIHNTHYFHSTSREAAEVQRLERLACKNVVTGNDLYNAISTIHNGIN